MLDETGERTFNKRYLNLFGSTDFVTTVPSNGLTVRRTSYGINPISMVDSDDVNYACGISWL